MGIYLYNLEELAYQHGLNIEILTQNIEESLYQRISAEKLMPLVNLISSKKSTTREGIIINDEILDLINNGKTTESINTLSKYLLDVLWSQYKYNPIGSIYTFEALWKEFSDIEKLKILEISRHLSKIRQINELEFNLIIENIENSLRTIEGIHQITDNLISFMGPFALKMFLAEAISIDGKGNLGFLTLGTRDNIISLLDRMGIHYTFSYNRIELLCSFLSAKIIKINNIRIRINNEIFSLVLALKDIANNYISLEDLKNRIVDSAISGLLSLLYDEVDSWARNMGFDNGYENKRQIIALLKEISQISVDYRSIPNYFIGKFILDLKSKYREIQSGTLKVLTTPQFKFRNNIYHLTLNERFIKEIKKINLPSLDSNDELFSYFRFDTYKLRGSYKLLVENCGSFIHLAYNELKIINEEFNSRPNIFIEKGSKLYFKISKHPFYQQLSTNRFFGSEYNVLDFSKPMDEPINLINLKRIYVSFYYGYSIGISKTNDIFQSNYMGDRGVNFVGRLSLFDCSKSYFDANEYELRLYKNIISSFLTQNDVSRMLYSFRGERRSSSYLYIMYSDIYSFFDLLFSYKLLNNKLNLMNWINLEYLNNLLGKSGENKKDWLIFYQLYTTNGFKLNSELLNHFIKIFIKDFETGKPIIYDNQYFPPGSYIIDESLEKALIINLFIK